jgi:hypothetical protein
VDKKIGVGGVGNAEPSHAIFSLFYSAPLCGLFG